MSPLISCNLSRKPSCWIFFDAVKQMKKNPGKPKQHFSVLRCILNPGL